MKKNVAVIPGDGIGPEVIGAALKVLEKVAPGKFDFHEVAMGGNAIDKYGVPNSGTARWASSDNSFDPMMSAYSGELELIDCGKYTEDSSLNVQQSQDNFAAEPYAF